MQSVPQNIIQTSNIMNIVIAVHKFKALAKTFNVQIFRNIGLLRLTVSSDYTLYVVYVSFEYSDAILYTKSSSSLSFSFKANI